MRPGELWRRLVYLVRRDGATRELEEEMRLHVEQRARTLAAAGLDPVEARRRARRAFGSGIRLSEASRDAWGLRWIEDAAADVRFGVRRLVRRPAFTISVAGVLALGIGATTAMFSAVDAALLRPLPFREPGRLLRLRDVQVPFDPGVAMPTPTGPQLVTLPEVAGLGDGRLFPQVAAWASGGLNLADPDRPMRLRVGVVTASFFETLGVGAARGRTFTAGEDVPGGPRAAILSDALWRGAFGARAIDGLTLDLNGVRWPVVGVMPAGFSFPDESQVWIPMTVPTTPATFDPFRGFLTSEVIARVADGVSTAAATRQLSALWDRKLGAEGTAQQRFYADRTLKELRTRGVTASLQRSLVGDRRTALFVLLGATLLLLLIACANATNLLLSHATGRRRELALRGVLGASRGRLLRQLLAESLLLAFGGTVLGVALAPAALGLIRTLLPSALTGVAAVRVDLRVLAFAAALALATGLAFGIWPATGLSRAESADAVRTGGDRGATRTGAGPARRTLIGVEVALTTLLLVGAGLLLRSFERVLHVDVGVDAEHVATLQLSFVRRSGPSGPLERRRRIDAMLGYLERIPGITASGAINDLPLGVRGGIALGVEVPGAPAASPADQPFARNLMVSKGYFSAMGIRLLHGRTFTDADDADAPRVAVINDLMARRFWPDMEPVGRTFRMGGPRDITVIGVVADVRAMNPESNPLPQAYFPIHQETPANVALVARGTLPPEALLGALRGAVRATDPAQAVYDVRMMDDVLHAAVAPRRTNTILITLFAGLALALAAFGVYAVVAYSVAQRARELGIRAALGAARGGLLLLVAREMVIVMLAGLAVGLAGAWALSRVLASLVYGVDVHDLATFALAPLALLVPALLATLVPARRAVRVDPVEVMRAE